MAKRRGTAGPGTISKSQAVRDYLSEHPTAKPKEIAPALSAAYGITVTPQMISMIKSKTNAQGRKRANEAPTRGRRPARRQASDVITVDELLSIKKLVDMLGGPERARRALDVLIQLG